MQWFDYVTMVCLGIGCFFALTGAVGLLRMPDFYSRLHPAGKSDTLAQFMIILGLIFQSTDNPMLMAKLAILTALLFVTAPTATHAISRAAELDGLEPWTKHGPAEGQRRDGTEVADG
jgi:multicomponent Na+:H+ antiporter subunit G